MNDSLSIFARALATENLTFSFSGEAETASFDVKNRHLVMPMWDVSDTMRTMLVAHEIAHALWTPYEISDRLFKEAEAQGYNGKILHHICNMIEDVRIEKLMKQKYPGTRRDFFIGYKEMIDKNMFGLGSYKWDKTDMVSRLNGHFKWGTPGFITVPLSADEQGIADLVNGVQTFEEGFALAKTLYDHPSMQQLIQKVAMQQAGTDGNGGEGTGEQDADPTKKGDLSDIGGSFVRKTGETVNMNTFTIGEIKNLKDAIIPSSFVLEKYEAYFTVIKTPFDMAPYRKFVRESDAFVRQMVAQFERRKAADEIRKERPKQTGMLNLDRLHQFRTHDDIFLSKIIKQEGKNHGIMFLIDFSGSMGDTIGDCIHQVLQLVWFCEKAKIPFEVYGFTELGHWGREKEVEAERTAYRAKNEQHDPYGNEFRSTFDIIPLNPKPTSVEIGATRLVQLASSTDKAADRERLLAMLYSTYCVGPDSIPNVIRFGGTPTVEAVAIVSQRMKEWVTANNIQIPTLMIVTDGQPNGVGTVDRNYTHAYINKSNSLMVTNEVFGTIKTIRHADYGEIDIPNGIISTMIESLKDSLNARCVGMYVVRGQSLNEHMFRGFCMGRYEYEDFRKKYAYDTIKDSPRYAACNQQFKDGALILPKRIYPGYDAFFVIRSMKSVNDAEAIADSGSFVKVKNTFVKTMGKRGTSRVFLSKYVDIVAGQPLRDEDEAMYRLPPGLTWEERNARHS